MRIFRTGKLGKITSPVKGLLRDGLFICESIPVRLGSFTYWFRKSREENLKWTGGDGARMRWLYWFIVIWSICVLITQIMIWGEVQLLRNDLDEFAIDMYIRTGGWDRGIK